MKERYSIAFVIVFLGLLLIPLRTMALDPYAIEESFYLRPRLINLISNIRLLLGDRVFPKVLVGDGGWLMFTGEGDLEVYEHATQFTPDELARFQHNLDALANHYAERGITLLVVVSPSKNSIYPERIPSAVPVLGMESKFNQLVLYLHEHGHTQLIDLRPALMEAKSEQQIYYATDSHWNDYGAYIAYSTLMDELQNKYPNLAAHPLSEFMVVKQKPDLLDLSRNMGSTLFPESKIELAPQSDSHTVYKTLNLGQRKLMLAYNPDDTLPNLVLYYDSFFFNVIPMLGEHFHQAYYIQNYTGGGLWNLSWVDEQHPDVVIIEFGERYLDDLPRFIDPER